MAEFLLLTKFTNKLVRDSFFFFSVIIYYKISNIVPCAIQ